MPKYFYNQRRNSRPGDENKRASEAQNGRRTSNSPPRRAAEDANRGPRGQPGNASLETDFLDAEVQTIVQAVLRQLNKTRAGPQPTTSTSTKDGDHTPQLVSSMRRSRSKTRAPSQQRQRSVHFSDDEGFETTTKQYGGQDPYLSTNPDFPNMWRALYKIVQIDHHTNNWATLPRTVRRQLYDMADNINPPDPTAELKQNIEDILIRAGGSIQTAIQTHMKTRRAAQVNILKNCDNTDMDRAIARAHKGLSMKLGKHIHDIRQRLTREATVIGTNKKRTMDQAITPPTADGSYKRYRLNASMPAAAAACGRPSDGAENITTDTDATVEPTDPTVEPMEDTDAGEYGTLPPGPPPTQRDQTAHASGSAKHNPILLLDDVADAMVSVRDDTEVVIIGDSSLDLADDQDLYANWQLMRTRTDTLHAIATTLSALPEGKIAAAVVIPGPAQGTQSEERNATDIENLKIAIASQKFRTKILGVSIAHSTPVEEQERLRSFNGALQRTFGKHYIFPPPMDVVELDGKGHYTTRTVYNMGSRIDYHFTRESPKN